MINAQPLPQLKNCAPLPQLDTRAPVPKLKNRIDYRRSPRTEFTRFEDIFSAGWEGDEQPVYDITIFDYEGLAHSTRLPMDHSAHRIFERILIPEPFLSPNNWKVELRKTYGDKFKMNLVNKVTSKEFFIALLD